MNLRGPVIDRADEMRASRTISGFQERLFMNFFHKPTLTDLSNLKLRNT